MMLWFVWWKTMKSFSKVHLYQTQMTLTCLPKLKIWRSHEIIDKILEVIWQEQTMAWVLREETVTWSRNRRKATIILKRNQLSLNQTTQYLEAWALKGVKAVKMAVATCFQWWLPRKVPQPPPNKRCTIEVQTDRVRCLIVSRFEEHKRVHPWFPKRQT